jgi:hypothetical protein
MSASAVGPTMQDWHERFRESDGRCPWPGPRPYRPEDARFLVGRTDDIKRFRQAVDEHTLVFLAGRSGVGKSSLTNAALVPDLQAAGHAVVVCDNWDDLKEDAVAYIAAVAFEQLRHLLVGFEAPNKRIFDELANLAASGHASIVLILDQFEELVRYSPKLAAEVEAMVLKLNRHTRLRIVISFRSEFLDQLRGLQQAARPFTSTTFSLGEVDASYARDLMEAANDKGTPPVIDSGAVDALVEEWKRAREETASVSDIDPFGKVGFLHLQALLYALHREAPDGRIDFQVVRGLSSSRGADLFRAGIGLSITGKLEDCAAAAAGADRYLMQGATAAVANTARHLSSGGYKLVQDAVELAALSFRDVFHALDMGIRASGVAGNRDGPLPAGQRAALLQRLLEEGGPAHDGAFDLLRDTTERIAEVLDREAGESGVAPLGRSWTDRLPCGASPWVADPKDVTNGPMMGRSPVAVLIEECRRYAIGIRWLQAASLIRLTHSLGQRAMVSLIHDGFGPALNEWAATQRRSPVAELHSITRPTGADFSWEDEEPRQHTEGTVEEPLVFANLRWRGAWVFASFKHCVFVNCDFRGTYFFRTRFEAAHFVNCQLDGAIFDACEVHGPVDELHVKDSWHTTSPWFTVDASAKLRRSLGRYQLISSDGSNALLSREPGYPAVPVDTTSDFAHPGVPLIKFTAQRGGGLIVYGGRLSAMVMRGTRFTGQGTVSFRHVAGAGLDLIGSVDGDVEVFGSALRHLTLTFDPLVRDEEGKKVRQGMQLRTVNSSLAQSWVGQEVHGRWAIDNCRITHLLNASDKMSINASADSALAGAVMDAADRRAMGREGGRFDRMDAQANPALRAEAARRQGSV